MRISDWSSDVCSSDLLEAVGIDREREVVIAQDKAVGHEIVRRVDKIEHLADGPIIGVLHLLLPQPKTLWCRCTAEECEGLRQHEREIDRQQRLKLSGGGGRRVFPDAEDAAKSATIGLEHPHRPAAATEALKLTSAHEGPPADW